MDLLLLPILLGACAAFVLAFAEGREWSPPSRPVLQALAVLGAILAAGRLAVMIDDWLPAESRVNSYDFKVFYDAALVARRWGPLYNLANIHLDPGEIVVYRHAPVGAALFIPLTVFPFDIARNAWRFLNLALYLGTLWSLLRHYRIGLTSPLALGLLTLWCVSTPSRDSLGLGQWDALFLTLSFAALVLLSARPDRDRDWLAGALLALPIALKFYPALLLIAPLVARRWRVLGGCALAGVALTLLGVFLAGPQNSWDYFTTVLPAVGGGTLYAENQSLYALIGRLFASDLTPNGVRSTYPVALTRLLADALALPLVLLTALTAWRRGGGLLAADLRFVLALPVALLAIPTAWAHYATWLLLPLAVLAVALSRAPLPWYSYFLFALAALLIPLGSERDVWDGGPYSLAARFLLTYKVYGYLALWLALLLTIWRLRAAPYHGTERRSGSLLFRRIKPY